MSLPLLTVFTDASYDPATGAAGWAVWAKRQDMGTFQYSAPFKMVMPGSNEAEAAALACAAAVLRAAKWAGGDHHVLMQTDSLAYIQAVGKFAHFKTHGWATPYMAPILELKAVVRCLELRHVKAHLSESKREKRNWVNETCDKAAKAAMRQARGNL